MPQTQPQPKMSTGATEDARPAPRAAMGVAARAWLRPVLVLIALGALPWIVGLATRPPAAHLLIETAITLALGIWILALIGRARDAERRHVREAARLSHVDPLTGLGNRQALERDLEPIVFRARRATTPLAVLRLDVNGQRQVNDRYGRACGDETLKHLGAVLRSSLRFGSDSAYRVGGDEFVAVLTAEPAAARAVASRIARVFTERSPRGSHVNVRVVPWDGEARAFDLLRAAVEPEPAEAQA